MLGEVRGKLAVLVSAGCLIAAPAAAAPITFGGHAYEFIAGSFSFDGAKTAAEGLTFGGATGHLVTITSAAENAFVLSLISSVEHSVWIGATDRAEEGTWRWVTGERFWHGGSASSGGTVGPDVLFAAWSAGQPDNFGTGQNVATIFGGSVATPERAGLWDDGGDGPDTGGSIFQRDGYLVEFDPVSVPEPATLLLMGAGLGAAGIRRVKRPRFARD